MLERLSSKELDEVLFVAEVDVGAPSVLGWLVGVELGFPGLGFNRPVFVAASVGAALPGFNGPVGVLADGVEAGPVLVAGLSTEGSSVTELSPQAMTPRGAAIHTQAANLLSNRGLFIDELGDSTNGGFVSLPPAPQPGKRRGAAPGRTSRHKPPATRVLSSHSLSKTGPSRRTATSPAAERRPFPTPATKPWLKRRAPDERRWKGQSWY